MSVERGTAASLVIFACFVARSAAAQSESAAPARNESPAAAAPLTAGAPRIRNMDSPSEPDPTLIRNLDSPAETSVPKRVATRWYGDQILVIDATSFVGAFLGASTSQKPLDSVLFDAGAAGFVLGGPIVHFAHGHSGKAVLSFAMRAVPALLIVDGAQGGGCAATAESGSGSCGAGIVLSALGLSLVPVAALFDSTVVAHEDVSRAHEVTARVVPWADPSKKRVGVGVHGEF